MFKKFIYIGLGSISLALGVLGIFLPLLPTTPFLLLSAFLYLRSSQKLYDWLLGHKHLGAYIKNFIENKSIPKKTKIYSISLMWTFMLVSGIFFTDSWWIRALLLLIGTGVSIHILSYKTSK